MTLTVGSLFAGIGGLELGLERCGMEVRWQVEIDPYATRVLAKHWPNVERHDDIKTWPKPGTERVDVICGGFPCQDISVAGKRAGLAGARSGLFFEAMRVVRDLEPRYLLLENVSALLVRGMDAVLGELAAVGMDAVWHCVTAASVGAPHRRDRVFIIGYRPDDVADANGHDAQAGRERRRPIREEAEFSRAPSQPSGRRQAVADTEGIPRWNQRKDPGNGAGGARRTEPGQSGQDVADASGDRCDEMPERKPFQGRQARPGVQLLADPSGPRLQGGEQRQAPGQGSRPPRPTAARGEAGRGDWWAVEPDICRVAHGIPKRVDRLRGLGNAVVPQVAEFVGRMILDMERQTNGKASSNDRNAGGVDSGLSAEIQAPYAHAGDASQRHNATGGPHQ